MAKSYNQQSLDLDELNNKKQKSKNAFSFDDEIVIGVTKTPSNKKAQKVKPKENDNFKSKNAKTTNDSKNKNAQISKNKKSKNQKSKNQKSKNVVKNKNKNKNISNEQLKKRKRIINIVKYSTLIIFILIAVICTMFSPLFNIKNIEVIGNEKITTAEIISLSQIQKEENTYKVSKRKTIEKIKQNAYIENVKIKRKLPSDIQIIIEERSASFLIEYAGNYIYINNQGYMLETSTQKLDLPIIQGQATLDDEYKTGNRLCQEDLQKLSDVLKIIDVAKENGIDKLITRIDISSSQNYKLIFESEGKIAYLGDTSNLITKILNIKKIIERETGVEGEIFLNMDYTSNPVFRQKV